MKICVVFIVFGLASADIWQRAEVTINNAIESFLEGVGQSGSLKAIIGLPEAEELNDIEDDIKENVVKIVKAELENYLQRAKESVDNGKAIAEKLLEMVKDIKEKLKELRKDEDQTSIVYLKNLKDLTKKSLKKLIESYGFGKRNLDQEMDLVARARFSEFVEKIKKQLLKSETIKKIREYIENFITKNLDLQKLKENLLQLEEEKIRELLDVTYQSYNNRKFCDDNKSKEKMDELFKDLSEDLHKKAKKLQDFLKDRWLFGLEKLGSGFAKVNALAIEVIGDGKDISGEKAREAMEFFRQYKDNLGSLWDQIMETIKSHVGQF